ncbi:MAG TPA: DUF1569 domain-containing protein [Pyrinomonadaceae bacterium]|jgi:hypothetical protein
MKTLWREDSRREIVERLANLNPDSKANWGKMNCPQMLAHVADGMRMALGDLKTEPKKTPLRFRPVKHLIIYWLPFPKGAPTAPELISRQAENIETEVSEIKDLIEKFAGRSEIVEWAQHPAFGKLSGKDWGALGYKHIDHHLKQFGV